MTQTSESIASANEDTYESLISLIENNQNQLSLIIVACDDLTLRQEIIGRYEREARLDNIQAKRIVLGTEPSLRAGLAKLELPAAARVVVTVTGSEWLLRVKTRSSDAQSDLQKFFGYLQWTREGLREFQYPIVLWITSPILLEMSRKAPDFWSWRKAVLRFTSESVNPVLPVEREHSSSPSPAAFTVSRMDRDDDDFIPPPAEILSEICQLAARDPESQNLATLYAKLAEIYTKRIASGEATDLEQEEQQAIDAYHQAIDRYRALSKKSALSDTLTKFGNFLDSISRYKEAIDVHQQSLKIDREIGNRRGEAASLGNLGISYGSLGEYQLAIDVHQQSLKIDREIGNRQGEANSLGNLGISYGSLGEYQLAIDFHQQSLKIQRELGDLHGEAASLYNFGNDYYSLGEYQRAIDFYQQSLEIKREIGDLRGEAESLGSLGIAYGSLGEYQRAIYFCQQSLEIASGIGNRSLEAASLFNQAMVLAKYEPCRFEALGQFKQARAIYAELKLDLMVEKCDRAIYAFNQNIATEQRKSAPTIGDPHPPEDWVKRSLDNDSTSRSTSSQKIHWLVWFGVGLGVCLLLFLLRRK
jgi:tetratricopeptide (TPR) repeat protein